MRLPRLPARKKRTLERGAPGRREERPGREGGGGGDTPQDACSTQMITIRHMLCFPLMNQRVREGSEWLSARQQLHFSPDECSRRGMHSAIACSIRVVIISRLLNVLMGVPVRGGQAEEERRGLQCTLDYPHVDRWMLLNAFGRP